MALIQSGSDAFLPSFRRRIADDGVYELTCLEGHVTVTVLAAMKFELLFDSGAHAFSDGYSREAVVSFAAAQERFYEFFVRAVCRKCGFADAAIKDLWTPMRRLSERQLGAFLFAHLVLLGKAHAVDENRSAFRNKVVHNGYFPKEAEAFDYGRYVYDTTTGLRDDLTRACPEASTGVTVACTDRSPVEAGPPCASTSSTLRSWRSASPTTMAGAEVATGSATVTPRLSTTVVV